MRRSAVGVVSEPIAPAPVSQPRRRDAAVEDSSPPQSFPASTSSVPQAKICPEGCGSVRTAAEDVLPGEIFDPSHFSQWALGVA
jgi:hypothetical protein